MNILRELRRIENRNLISKSRAVLLLCVMLITSTFAWFLTQKNINIQSIRGDVDSWDVIYKYEGQVLDESIDFYVSDFYPGKEYTKVVDIYNMGENPSSLSITLEDVIYMNESKMIYLQSNDGIKTYSDGRIVKIFDIADYPFEVIYTLNRKYLYEQYSEDDPTSTPNAYATLTITLNWDYDRINSSEDTNTTVGDTSDSNIGSQIYNYYNSISNQVNYEELCAKALQVKLRLRADTTSIENIDQNEDLINGVGREYMNEV